MPQMDGAELAKEIKNHSTLKSIKLVMMTSMAARGDASYFKNLGFSAYFPKPAITKDLFKTLNLCLANPESLGAELPLITHHYLEENALNTEAHDDEVVKENSKNSLSQCRLLLVEDNRINQEVARHILAEFDIIPDIAENGLVALSKLKTSENKALYDIILMDCQMPEMDGYQATTAIRQGQGGWQHKNITIIAMTANAMKGDREKCLDAGMTDYLSKPIEPSQLKGKLNQYFRVEINNATLSKSDENSAIVNITKTEAAPEIEVKTESKAIETSEQDSIDDNEPLVVWQRANFNKRLNNNKEIQYKLIALFIEETPKQLDQLAQCIAQNDSVQQHEISHKLQGMSANLNAQELLNMTKEFNQLVKEPSANQTKVEQLFDAMKLSYQNLEKELTAALAEQVS